MLDPRTMKWLILITTLLVGLTHLVAAQPMKKLDVKCNTAVNSEIKKGKLGETALANWSDQFVNVKISGRFSTTINGCLAMVEDFLQNRWFIYDLYNMILDRGVALFFCDKGGVNNVRLDAAQRYTGKLMDTSYHRFADNAEGGPPAILQPPGRPYRRSRCRKIFNRRILELTQE